MLDFKKYVWVALMLLPALMLAQPSSHGKWLIKNKASLEVQKFPTSHVTLLKGPFKDAMERNIQYLLELEPDRLLHWHRKVADLQPKGDHYGGWDNGGSIALGHHLSACALQYEATGDKRMLDRVNYIVKELAECQRNNKDGSLIGVPANVEAMQKAAKGEIVYNLVGPEFPFMNGANPWYCIHKDFAGLRDAYFYCNNEQAKNVLLKFSDWAVDFSNRFTTEQFQKMLDVEHGGMSEVLADAYAISGDLKYLDLAKKFIHYRVTDPIANHQDILWPHHANAQIPKFVGYERIYQLEGQENLYAHTISKNFYNMVLDHHTLAIGGNSEYERFGPPGKVSQRIGVSAAETCNTYNMLKLAHQLYQVDGDSHYMDYYERALYNHILASQDPVQGTFTYYVSLKPGHFKSYSTKFNSFWCCVGTGMENHTKYGESIYGFSDESLYVNLFIASKLTWKEKDFVLRQETEFPVKNNVKLVVERSNKNMQTLKIRYPVWANGMPTVKINGNRASIEKDDKGYLVLKRSWKKGDVVEITLPMQLQLERTPDNPNIAAVLYGPIVLAGDLGNKGLNKETSYAGPDAWENTNKNKLTRIPMLIGDTAHLGQWISPIAEKPLSFKVKSSDEEITFLPFYQMHHKRYSVYWDVFSPQEWNEYQHLKKEHITDEVIIGDSISEASHHLKGEKTFVKQNFLRMFRGASSNGWFSYDMKVNSQLPQFVVVKLWGTGWGEEPVGQLEVLVEGNLIARHNLGDKDHETLFYDQHFAIPQNFIQGKKEINVLFRFVGEKTAGGIYGCKLTTPQGLNIQPLLKEQ